MTKEEFKLYCTMLDLQKCLVKVGERIYHIQQSRKGYCFAIFDFQSGRVIDEGEISFAKSVPDAMRILCEDRLYDAPDIEFLPDELFYKQLMFRGCYEETKNAARMLIIREFVADQSEDFRYQLLNRMQSDCRYYLGYGARDPRFLWAGNPRDQIDYMIALWDSFPENKKPEWISMYEINEYKWNMGLRD